MPNALSPAQQFLLVVLRMAVGWHFLYEGLYKLLSPAWSRAGLPLAHWSAASYLKASAGPLSSLFQALASPPWVKAVDTAVAVSLVLVGLSLILGLFTQLGALGALVLLALFYLSAIPTTGVHQPGAEGAYLIVNKNVVEAAAVAVLLSFRTGRIAGLDLLLSGRRTAEPSVEVVPS
jgi:thiosulfate dehydrogenase (quinone) large subunit